MSPSESDFTLGMSFSVNSGGNFFNRQSAIISLDNSEVFGIKGSFEIASSLPDNSGLFFSLKRIWAICCSTIPAFSSITIISL